MPSHQRQVPLSLPPRNSQSSQMDQCACMKHTQLLHYSYTLDCVYTNEWCTFQSPTLCCDCLLSIQSQCQQSYDLEVTSIPSKWYSQWCDLQGFNRKDWFLLHITLLTLNIHTGPRSNSWSCFGRSYWQQWSVGLKALFVQCTLRLWRQVQEVENNPCVYKSSSQRLHRRVFTCVELYFSDPKTCQILYLATLE